MRRVLLVSLVVCLLTPLLLAEEWEREVREMQRRIATLRAEAREADRAGREREARELRTEAEALAKRVEKATEQRRRKRSAQKEPGELRDVLRGLSQGVKALVALGRHEQAEQLEKIAVEVKRKLAAQEQRRRGSGRDTIETMRIAMHALLEAEQQAKAERIEQAIHAWELRMEGRRDKAAQEVYERAPKVGELAELFGRAAQVLGELNHQELAGRVAKLAKMHKQQWARQRKGRKEAERDRERERPARAERLMERIERLEQRLDEVTALLERLVRQIDRRDG